MKLAFLAGSNSTHTVKWVNEMVLRGHEVHLISLHRDGRTLDERVIVHLLPFSPPLGYYLNIIALIKKLRLINPDLLHVHYASGYGTLARLSKFHPILLSSWGSDILLFPNQSWLKKRLLKKNLENADIVSSVCVLMKNEIMRINQRIESVEVLPFGVDCLKFSPGEKNPKSLLRFGTVKSLNPVYGISTLIKAFYISCQQGLEGAELVIVGGGPQEAELKSLVEELGLSTRTKFVGPVNQEEVPRWLRSFDVFLALSESEGLSVSVLEAAACGLPVIVSEAGGLPETLIDGETGFIVPRNNPEAAAERILQLAENFQLRKSMGKKGRQFVLQNYEWKENADRMERLYEELVKDDRDN